MLVKLQIDLVLRAFICNFGGSLTSPPEIYPMKNRCSNGSPNAGNRCSNGSSEMGKHLSQRETSLGFSR
jgi:hypothetical protein